MRFKDKLLCDNCGNIVKTSKEIEKEQTQRRKDGSNYNLLVQCDKCKKEGLII